jgi:Polyketide cyclase / dehydrase and lipid transport
MADLVVGVEVAAPPQAVWDALVDWDRQGDWMLGTRVRGTVHAGVGVGAGIEAFTGVGRVGFLDTMVITVWDPPHRCDVEHTGRLIRGSGVFEVLSLPTGSRLVWTERLELPLGWAGRIGWPVVRPLVAAGVRRSLRNLARQVEAGR